MQKINHDGLTYELKPFAFPKSKPSIGLHFATIVILFGLLVGAVVVGNWIVR